MYESRFDASVRLAKMLSEAWHYAFLERVPVNKWSFTRDLPKESESAELASIGFRWNPQPFPVYFDKSVRLPEVGSGQRLLLRGDFGGETLVTVDRESFGELNEKHGDIDLTPFCDGDEHRITMEVVPRSLFGKPVFTPELRESTLFLLDKEVYDVFYDVDQVIELLRWTLKEDLANRLCRLLDRTLASIDIPRDTRSYRSSVVDDAIMIKEVNNVWAPEKLEADHSAKLSKNAKSRILQAGQLLRKELSSLKELYPNTGSITVFGHAHIDYAWLWPVEETKRKIQRTFANSVRLSEKFSDFLFTQSSAKLYSDLKSTDPLLFSKVVELVTEGQWEPIGGSWVEFDSNLASPESLIRQFLMGQDYFEKCFGKRCKVAWLPDIFGFSWVMPQILRSAGIGYLVTTKLNWNDKNQFPYDLCRWRGIDGSEVIYHSFRNPNEGFNAHLDVRDIQQTWQNYREKDCHFETILSNGYGDGGGGPTDEMLERFLRLKGFPEIPSLKMRKVEEFFDDLEKSTEEFPVWDGELYLERHRGTYSSELRTKYLHKKAEDVLYETEYLATVLCDFNDFPYEVLFDCWDVLLRNEFHDILPGSSIREVHSKAEEELGELIDKATEIGRRMTAKVSESQDDKLTVINTSSFSKRLSFVLEEPANYGVYDEEGVCLQSQKIFQGGVLFTHDREIGPFEKLTLNKTSELGIVKPEQGKEDDLVMENKHIRAEVLPDGTISLFDKDLNRDVFCPSGNQLYLYKDIPPHGDAWDISVELGRHGRRILPDSISRTDWGPLKHCVRVTYKTQGSVIKQLYSLEGDSRRVDTKTVIDWHTRRTMLKAFFPMNVLARHASYDLSCGFIRRPTHGNRSFDQAMFEVPGHRWADLSEYGFGVSILNNGLYGHNARGSILSLTLIRSPIFPSFFSGEGEHSFVYSIFPHDGSSLLSTAREAEELNKPLSVFHGELVEFPERILEMGHNSETLKIMALKRSQKGGIIIRVCEILGKRGNTDLKIRLPFSRVFICNVLEEPIRELPQEGGEVEIEYGPFSIITLLLAEA